ncbi:MAG: UbiH/UbiF/VisC/COQ6 family ubiquinone biosynthesis hydroxylase [Xanthomonadales bacterium]|nr:UbiH/UbiF/VisC/COQ6 family ubiquinone biosynthesis hydroxylase [Xanthomonadales bacterium]
MSRQARLDVIVVGGGPVGAAAALALARADFKVALIEAHTPSAWHSEDELDLRVLALAPSSARLLDGLGVWEALRDARASAYAHMRVEDAASGASLNFAASELGVDALGWIVENRLLQQVLWRALDGAGVRCVCPARVEGVRAQAERISVDLAAGDVLSAQLLVAADGAGSPLRGMLGIELSKHDYAQRALVAHVRSERAHQHTAWQRFLPGGPLALLPLADGRSSLVWSLLQDEAKRLLELDDAAFLNELGMASDFHLGRLLQTTPRAAFPLRMNLARHYHAPRAVLLGDAAHVVHPLAGQGVNLGLRDVAELRDSLVAARARGRDIAAEDVLAGYARRRRSADTLDAWSIDGLARVFAWQSPALIGLRALGLRSVDRLGIVKRALGAHASGL